MPCRCCGPRFSSPASISHTCSCGGGIFAVWHATLRDSFSPHALLVKSVSKNPGHVTTCLSRLILLLCADTRQGVVGGHSQSSNQTSETVLAECGLWCASDLSLSVHGQNLPHSHKYSPLYACMSLLFPHAHFVTYFPCQRDLEKHSQ